jgi:hypothetical protein
MPSFDYKQLKQALKLIRSVCGEVENCCEACPFGDDSGECHITNVDPFRWCIKEEKPDVVRVMV